jgi:hypothetical protein
MARCCHRNLLIINGPNWKPISLPTFVTRKALAVGSNENINRLLHQSFPKGTEDAKRPGQKQKMDRRQLATIRSANRLAYEKAWSRFVDR